MKKALALALALLVATPAWADYRYNPYTGKLDYYEKSEEPDLSAYLTSATAASTYAPITEPLSVHLDQTTDTQAITATDTTITASDEIYYGDATDTFKIKKDTIQGILDLVPSPDLSNYALLSGATFSGNITASNLSGTNTGDQDLSPYWKSDGTSTATGNWDIGTRTFKSVNLQADTTRTFLGTKLTAGSITSTDSVFIGEAILGVLNRTISGSKNVGIGYYGLSRLSSGAYNTAVGVEAGGSTTGTYNSFFGYRAGLYTLGTANWAAPINGVYIGANTESAASGRTNEIVIGYNADGKGSNTAVIGNTSTTGLYLPADNYKLYFGAGDDASISYDGTNLIINPKVVGSGYLSVLGDMDAGANTIRTTGDVKGVHKAADGTAAVADGTYTVGIGTSTNGTITIKDGIITAITEAT